MNIYISGASGYLGRLLAFNFAKQGNNLILGGRDGFSLSKLERELVSEYPKISINKVIGDLSLRSDWELIIDQLKNYQIDAFINCAAVHGPISKIADLKIEDLEATMNLNLYSSIFFSNYFTNLASKKNPIRIIHFSGGGATAPRPYFMSYSLSKIALIRFVENFAAEKNSRVVRINAISPGVLPSRMQEEVLASSLLQETKESATAIKSLANKNPENDRLLGLCNYLLSVNSAGITGKLISAEWDKWEVFQDHLVELTESDLFTLRRIVGRDRGIVWGDN
jgi:3-oxoacyl-[acyl-carrier protein] reductase